MGIPTFVHFDVIDLVNGIFSYLPLVGTPRVQRMKATISLEKERIKLKGNSKKIIIPLEPEKESHGSSHGMNI